MASKSAISDAPAANKPPPRVTERTWMGLVLLPILFLLSIWLVNSADDTKPKDWNESQLTYLPSGKMIKPMMMDLDEAAGDLLWINAMMYFADAYLSNRSYKWLGHMLDVVSTLNPHLYYTYEFAGVVLTKEKSELPKTMVLLQRGMREFPDDWQLHLYGALTQLALDSNYAKAAEYLEPITMRKDIPQYIRAFCATLLNRSAGPKVALAFLMDRWLHSENAITREILVKKILKIYPASEIPDNVRMDAVNRVLNEIAITPQVEPRGLEIIDEYMSGTLSPKNQTLMDMLYK
ncbi:MAG: hypothetical protein ABI036_06155 [Fibrobacteria bacterium]